MRNEAVSIILCLAEKYEIHEKSYEYAEALAGDIAKRLRSGEAVMIHCADASSPLVRFRLRAALAG